jgi:hypothetical protein
MLFGDACNYNNIVVINLIFNIFTRKHTEGTKRQHSMTRMSRKVRSAKYSKLVLKHSQAPVEVKEVNSTHLYEVSCAVFNLEIAPLLVVPTPRERLCRCLFRPHARLQAGRQGGAGRSHYPCGK